MRQRTASSPAGTPAGTTVALRRPEIADGAALWRLARDSGTLDVNASYAYLLWCRDFAATSVLATAGEEPAGFVSGYLRPDHPGTLMVWQVAVDAGHRGRGLGRRMLHDLVDRHRGSVWALETTVTADNEASIRLFERFAGDRGAGVTREPLFDAELFPDGHDPELLFRIEPLS